MDIIEEAEIESEKAIKIKQISNTLKATRGTIRTADILNQIITNESSKAENIIKETHISLRTLEMYIQYIGGFDKRTITNYIDFMIEQNLVQFQDEELQNNYNYYNILKSIQKTSKEKNKIKLKINHNEAMNFIQTHKNTYTDNTTNNTSNNICNITKNNNYRKVRKTMNIPADIDERVKNYLKDTKITNMYYTDFVAFALDQKLKEIGY